MLARSVDLNEVKDVQDKAKALALYAREKKAADESIRDAEEIAGRATRRIGQLTAAMEKSGGPGRGKKKSPGRTSFSKTSELWSAEQGRKRSKADALAEVGLTKQQAHRAERLAAIPDEEFERRVSEGRRTGRLSVSALLADRDADPEEREKWAEAHDTAAFLDDVVRRVRDDLLPRFEIAAADYDADGQKLYTRPLMASRVEAAITFLKDYQAKLGVRPKRGVLKAVK